MINEIIKKLFAKRVILKGNALSDDFGTTLIAKDADIINIDIKQKSEIILQELEEIQLNLNKHGGFLQANIMTQKLKLKEKVRWFHHI